MIQVWEWGVIIENSYIQFLFQCYVGHIPRDCFEDELFVIFEPLGRIYDLRIMMDNTTGIPRGYGFVTYVQKGIAKQAQEKVRN